MASTRTPFGDEFVYWDEEGKVQDQDDKDYIEEEKGGDEQEETEEEQFEEAYQEWLEALIRGNLKEAAASLREIVDPLLRRRCAGNTKTFYYFLIDLQKPEKMGSTRARFKRLPPEVQDVYRTSVPAHTKRKVPESNRKKTTEHTKKPRPLPQSLDEIGVAITRILEDCRLTFSRRVVEELVSMTDAFWKWNAPETKNFVSRSVFIAGPSTIALAGLLLKEGFSEGGKRMTKERLAVLLGVKPSTVKNKLDALSLTLRKSVWELIKKNGAFSIRRLTVKQ